jgi:outer membrane immunogenic protein
MRITSVTALAYISIGGMAAAADLRAPIYTPVQDIPAWAGFYIGANGGGAVGSSDNDFNIAGGPTFASVDLSMKGAIGGGQVGYNWQTGAMVLGVEADFQGSSLKGSISTPCIAPACALPLTARFSQELSWFGTVRARVGYAQAGWLLYATGGYAYGRVETDATATAGPVTASLSTSETSSGWTAGAGAEVLFAPRWSVKVEYLYVDLGRATTSYVFTGLPTLNDSKNVTFNVFRAGVNYKF